MGAVALAALLLLESYERRAKRRYWDRYADLTRLHTDKDTTESGKVTSEGAARDSEKHSGLCRDGAGRKVEGRTTVPAGKALVKGRNRLGGNGQA